MVSAHQRWQLGSVAGWGLWLLLSSGGVLAGSGDQPCPADSFAASYSCLQQSDPARLGLASVPLVRQYLIYAQKLAQDRRLLGLSDAAALAALSSRYRQLQDDPEGAESCARFAERILCY